MNKCKHLGSVLTWKECSVSLLEKKINLMLQMNMYFIVRKGLLHQSVKAGSYGSSREVMLCRLQTSTINQSINTWNLNISIYLFIYLNSDKQVALEGQALA